MTGCALIRVIAGLTKPFFTRQRDNLIFFGEIFIFTGQTQFWDKT
jgi:hypothetical protein